MYRFSLAFKGATDASQSRDARGTVHVSEGSAFALFDDRGLTLENWVFVAFWRPYLTKADFGLWSRMHRFTGTSDGCLSGSVLKMSRELYNI